MNEYKEMYLELMRSVEKALRILINAQRKCEELFLSAEDEKGAAAQGESATIETFFEKKP